MSLAGVGVWDRALHLAAAAKAEWERIGADVHMRFWDELMDRHLSGARLALGPEAADHAWATGKLIPFDQAVAIALESREEDGPTAAELETA